MDSLRPSSVVVGPLPPPVHGASVVTQRVAALFGELGHVRTINTAMPRGRVALLWHARRLWTHVAASLQVLRLCGAGRACLYLSVPGGYSVYEMLIVGFAARIRGARVILHHHSFSYVTHRSLGHRLFFSMVPGATHVALCSDMKRQLQAKYSSIGVIHVWSNMHPMGLPPVPQRPLPAPGEPMAIGHMANLTIEKGLDVVLETLRTGLARGLDLTLCLAGEPSDRQSQVLLDAAVADFGGRIHLWGFVRDAEKDRFMESVDAFVFPSKYRNEAEPVVVLEALSHGVPCFATTVGCLGSMPGVHSIPDVSAFAAAVVDCLEGSSSITPLGAGPDEPTDGSAIDFVAKLADGGR